MSDFKEVEIRIQRIGDHYALQIVNINNNGTAHSYVLYYERYKKITFSGDIYTVGSSHNNETK